MQVFGTVDQVRRSSHALGEFTQAIGVGAVRTANHQHHIAFVGQLLDRILTVLRGVADVVLAWTADGRETRTQGVDDATGIVHGQRGLGHERQFFGVVHLQFGDVFLVFDEVDRTAIAGIVLAHGAFDFRVPGVADKDAFTAVAAVACDFDVHLGHQRASGIEHFQATAGGFGAHSLGNTVGAEDHDHVVRHLIQLLDEDRATIAQVFDDEFVVDHFVAHIDRRPEDFQGAVDDFDRPVHAGAEATGVGEFDLHAVPRVLRARNIENREKPVWERACSRRRHHIQHSC
ncbi:hypothetical protein D3C87_1291890 [compost metagenome]